MENPKVTGILGILLLLFGGGLTYYGYRKLQTNPSSANVKTNTGCNTCGGFYSKILKS